VTVISDAAAFAMMARVDKVIIGCHAVVANGGLITESGVHGIAIAAKHHKVPVVCVTGMYKVCMLGLSRAAMGACDVIILTNPRSVYAALPGISAQSGQHQ